jgi:hypothetical protein
VILRCPTTVLLLAMASGALADPSPTFHGLYGRPEESAAAEATVSVTTCDAGGSLSVGTKFLVAANTFIAYVVRVGPDGSRLWETTYPGVRWTTASSVIESRDRSGFIVAGAAVTNDGTYDVLLLKLDCTGKPIWTRAYGDSRSEEPLAMTEARTGNIWAGTQAGDLLIAGRYALDGMLLRVNAKDGRVLWQKSYQNAQAARFTDLIEAKPSFGRPTGDVVAVGVIDDFATAGRRGYAIRVDGDTGEVNTPSSIHGAAFYGTLDGTDVNLRGVTELPTGALVFVGGAGPLAGERIYAARTSPRPWDVRWQMLIGEPWYINSAADVLQLGGGRLAVTGATGFGTGPMRSFLLTLDAPALKPIPGSGRLYGEDAAGITLLAHPSGFAIGGSSGRLHPNSSAHNVYLLSTDSDGRTGCEKDWEPPVEIAEIVVSRAATVAHALAFQTSTPVLPPTDAATPPLIECGN